MMAAISIVGGIKRLLPIPGLDDGHLATYPIEAVIRRKLPTHLANAMFRADVFIITSLGLIGLSLDLMALI